MSSVLIATYSTRRLSAGSSRGWTSRNIEKYVRHNATWFRNWYCNLARQPRCVYGPTQRGGCPALSWHCNASQCRTAIPASGSSRDVPWTRTPRCPAWTRRETWVSPDWNTERFTRAVVCAWTLVFAARLLVLLCSLTLKLISHVIRSPCYTRRTHLSRVQRMNLSISSRGAGAPHEIFGRARLTNVVKERMSRAEAKLESILIRSLIIKKNNNKLRNWG